mmetsp:Transcript_89140/g.252601  ORF Transcript_89140/g.252601 Transcript_89140/m.252601 type:complete len:181 (+) Transcript_89140:90-632(+)
MGRAGQTRGSFRTFGRKRVSGRKVKATTRPQKLKKNISPGSVLILLTGKFRGRRVVYVKQLASGELLVTGPFAVNGVPIKKVGQRFCIATSTKVELAGADYSGVTGEWFAAEKKEKTTKSGGEKEFFAETEGKKGMPEEKKAKQKSMDAPLVKSLSDDHKLYLKARFALSQRMYPHEMKF